MSRPSPKADPIYISDGESNDHEWPPDNGLRVQGAPRGYENIYDYEQGEHHPVHLGDILHQQYKVLHKLGSGGFANVWLCFDTSAERPCYMALKIIMAEVSTPDCPEFRVSQLVNGRSLSDELFCLPLDLFEIDGPNGRHNVFVYPVLGPNVASIPRGNAIDGKVPYREICSQVAHAMAVLHEHGICHGGMLCLSNLCYQSANNTTDFRPANILTRLSGLDGLNQDKLFTIMGKPETARVTTRDGGPHSLPSAPQYVVCPLDWDYIAESSETGAKMITYKACVTDFGESYKVSSPPLDLGIPMAYSAPEYDLEKKTGISNDLWALGCTLFEIHAGRKVLDMFEEELDEHLFIIATVLGKMPEPWWPETWERRRENFKDGVDETGASYGRRFEHPYLWEAKVSARSDNLLRQGWPRRGF